MVLGAGALPRLRCARRPGRARRVVAPSDVAIDARLPAARAALGDSIGRRVGSDDPDTDDLTNTDAATRTWRYLFNRVGDLVAVRDPRGCGQNFYYDLGGRLAGEAYVSCGEAQTSRADLPSESIAGLVGNTSSEPAVLLDTVYHYDADPSWAAALVPASASGRLGRATGVSDRGQRAAIAYDDRGNAIWTARQMAVIPDALALAPPPFEGGAVPVVLETAPAMGTTVAYDTAHTYVRTAAFDHAGRPTSMALPRDPDYGGAAPLVTGALSYDRRGLPSSASLAIDGVVHTVVDSIHYLRDGLVDEVRFGEGGLVLSTSSTYDDRRRPVRMAATRTPHDADPLERSLAGVTVVADQELVWDSSSNLVAVRDHRDPREWPAGHRPQSVEIEHDSLYRVVSAMFHYSQDDESLGSDVSSDWRSSQAEIRSAGADPMRGEPAPMVSSSPPTRVRSLTWEWDWLGNMVEWTDDAQSFYERSLGDIVNGRGLRASGVATDRPSALYLASNIPESGPAPSDGAGWVEVRYGVGGNVTSLTVHGECRDVSMGTCTDDPDLDRVTRADALRTGCECATEQHYEYRWDELDRIAEARRWDRDATLTSDWTFAVRQRYRYDGANVRTVKQTLDPDGTDERIALYVYAGDFERRGLVRGALTYEAADSPSRTETQYLVAGARLVWTSGEPPIGALDRDHRLTIPVSDLLQTTTGVIDLLSGDLLEVSTYYPNGARETLLLDSDGIERVASEPMGFTGKEADEEVGLVYFGERYLMARLARWASPDPLHVHASGGGEALNSYHYVGGRLLAARDPLGLKAVTESVEISVNSPQTGEPEGGVAASLTAPEQAETLLRDIRSGVRQHERAFFGTSCNDSGSRCEIVLSESGWAASQRDSLSGFARRWVEVIGDSRDHVIVAVPTFERGALGDAYFAPSAHTGMPGIERFSARFASGRQEGFTLGATYQEGVSEAGEASYYSTFREGAQLHDRAIARFVTHARPYGRTSGDDDPNIRYLFSGGDTAEARWRLRQSAAIVALHEPYVHSLLGLTHRQDRRAFVESARIVREFWRNYYARDGAYPLAPSRVDEIIEQRVAEVPE